MLRKRTILTALLIVVIAASAYGVWWYMKNTVKLVTKDERRALVVTEVTNALERYYDEHGRYPVVYTNEELLRELSAKAYFENEVRIDVVQYVPINNGQTFELR